MAGPRTDQRAGVTKLRRKCAELEPVSKHERAAGAVGDRAGRRANPTGILVGFPRVRVAILRRVHDRHPACGSFETGSYSASCWYAIDWKLSRCSGETPSSAIAARCSGVE